MAFFVYIIYSSTYKVKYTGHTEDMSVRLHQHNNGLLGRYTKNKGPWILIHLEEFETRAEAMLREKYLKTGAGRDWIKENVSL